MSLLLSAIRAGIFDRAMDICEDALAPVTAQISSGVAQIRSYRMHLDRKRRHFGERRHHR